MLSPEEFFTALMWEPDYGQCFYCSDHINQVPADYEMWFELRGDMLLDAYNEALPPHTVCQTACAHCVAHVRGEPGDDMPLLIVRDLRR